MWPVIYLIISGTFFLLKEYSISWNLRKCVWVSKPCRIILHIYCRPLRCTKFPVMISRVSACWSFMKSITWAMSPCAMHCWVIEKETSQVCSRTSFILSWKEEGIMFSSANSKTKKLTLSLKKKTEKPTSRWHTYCHLLKRLIESFPSYEW